MRKGRLIALLTDFGYRDTYVAAMKGVICTISPGTLVVDVTHDVPRHDITSAAYHLSRIFPYYPGGTVFVCVVDPGVGTRRRILCLEKGGQTFLAPDNGMLNYLSDRSGIERLFALNRVPGMKRAAKTFHGRDIFAPAAALIAGGRKVSSLGKRTARLTPRPLFIGAPQKSGTFVRARVLDIDHFGNIITNASLPARTAGRYTVTAGKKLISNYAETYGHAPGKKPFYLRGSSGLLEISIREGDASRVLKVKTGDSLTIRRTA